MQQLLIGVILVLGMGSYYLYNQNQTLSANNVALEYAVEEQKATMTALRENFERQTAALQNMSRKNAEIEEDKARYLSILSKHNFERLATVKPGLMENRFNKGTVEVIEGIENDTKDISNLESPNTND
jgi:predicted RNase H-like nuclease (RuvC/YqgF family)